MSEAPTNFLGCYHCHSSTSPSYVNDMLHKNPSHSFIPHSSSHSVPLLNRCAQSKATLCDLSFLHLSGTPFHMMSGVTHDCNFLVSFDDIVFLICLQRLNILSSLCASAYFGYLIQFLPAFSFSRKKSLICIKIKINPFLQHLLSASINAFVYGVFPLIYALLLFIKCSFFAGMLSTHCLIHSLLCIMYSAS